MKKIINYIAAVGMIMSAVSCSFTDLEPTDKVGDKEIFSSVTTLEQALTGKLLSVSVLFYRMMYIKVVRMEVPEMTHINGLTVLPPVIIIPCGLPIIRL